MSVLASYSNRERNAIEMYSLGMHSLVQKKAQETTYQSEIFLRVFHSLQQSICIFLKEVWKWMHTTPWLSLTGGTRESYFSLVVCKCSGGKVGSGAIAFLVWSRSSSHSQIHQKHQRRELTTKRLLLKTRAKRVGKVYL